MRFVRQQLVMSAIVAGVCIGNFSCNTVPGDGGGILGDPDIDVSPTSITFSEDDATSGTAHTITVNNNGLSVLTVSETSLSGSAAFSITNGGAPFTVAAGDTRLIEITFGVISVDTEAAILSIVSDDPDEGTVSVQLIGGASNLIESTIDRDRNFGNLFANPALPDYFIDGAISVTGDISFEPGVTVLFEAGSGLVVQADGSINMIGTAAEPIVFSGTVATAGSWLGINIFSNNPLNEIRFAEILFGGSARGSGQSHEANVYVQSAGSLSISDTTVADGRGYGMAAENGALITEFSRNTFERNQEAPLRIPAALIGSLGGDSALAGGNTNEYIEVFNTSVEDATWRAQDVPYRFGGTTVVEGNVSILPGFTAWFDTGAALQISASGSLSAIGTADNRITFQGEVEAVGQWRSLNYFSASPLNELEYCIVRHGGGSLGSGQAATANVYMQSSSMLAMTNTLIENSGGAGLSAENGARLSGFESNSFSGNTNASVDIPATLAGAMDGASTFTGGNGGDWVNVDGATVTENTTWNRLDAPYRFEDSATTIEGDVIIEAGATIAFASDAGIIVAANGSLAAPGEASDPILFTADDEVSSGTGSVGHWRGINIFSNSVANVFDNVVIEFGGSARGSGQEREANFYVQSTGRATFTNSTSRASGGWGTYVENNGVLPADPSNSFANNAFGDVGP